MNAFFKIADQIFYAFLSLVFKKEGRKGRIKEVRKHESGEGRTEGEEGETDREGRKPKNIKITLNLQYIFSSLDEQ
jgi:hypothetical protein